MTSAAASQATDPPTAKEQEEPKSTTEHEEEMVGEWTELMGQDLQLKVSTKELVSVLDTDIV